jgi:hypothetical protein
MAEGAQTGISLLLPATELARTLTLRRSPNGVRFASFGETRIADLDLNRIVEAVPAAIAPALGSRGFYFVPLALAEVADRKAMVAVNYTAELSDEAICHRNVDLAATASEPAHEGVFISARLLEDNFALAFEFYINVGHAFAAAAGIPQAFVDLAWSQALGGVRGETSQDAFEARQDALAGHKPATAPTSRSLREKRPERAPRPTLIEVPQFDEKAKSEFLEAAFADALAIYQLSLAVDFDYSELREREYPLLAPAALGARLRLMAELFPPNEGYEFAIKYRRRA